MFVTFDCKNIVWSLCTDTIDVSSLELLLQNVCLLLSSRTRDIVKASLGFLKVLLFSLDVKVLASHITVIVSEEERMFSSSYLNIQKVSKRCMLK